MANKIQEFRQLKGYTQEQLAVLLNISGDYLGKIERGQKVPSLKLAVRIAKLLDCTLNDLFFY